MRFSRGLSNDITQDVAIWAVASPCGTPYTNNNLATSISSMFSLTLFKMGLGLVPWSSTLFKKGLGKKVYIVYGKHEALGA